MTHRPVETILDEWQTLERALGSSSDATERIDLGRAVTDLAAEYHEAVDAGESAPETEDVTTA